ncbi:MAG TPA: hypothetical protein PK280_13910 [Planctomycetota bacterium]|nr:hypothetical protein [Planctomycetota bacterium]
MTRTLALLLTGAFLLTGASPGAEPVKGKAVAGAESWEARAEKALDAAASVDGWKDASLKDVLDVISKAAGVAVVLDPKAAPEADKVKITMTIPKESGMTLRSVLGNVLKLSGLRYALKDQAIFVSTRERLVADLLSPDSRPAPYVPGVSGPMTAGDAIASTVDFFDGSEEFIPETVLDFVRGPVDARFETRPYRDAQGRLHFPGPPMVIQDPNLLNPVYRFDTKPYFLKPEYLAPLYWGPQGRQVGAVESGASVRDTEVLKALLDYMQKNPELTVGQLIQRLEQVQTQKK